MIWNMTLSFGKVTPQSILANMISSGVGTEAGGGRLTNDQIFEMIDILDANTEANRKALNNLIGAWNNLILGESIPKLHVSERMKIPVGTDKFG